jgi:hypothetical protein
MMMMMSVEQSVEQLTGDAEVLGENPPGAALSTNPA